MKIIHNFNTVKSKAKLRLIEQAQNLGILPAGAGANETLSRWNDGLIPDTADSERCVEIPWVASCISRSLGLWLDVGYAHAEPRFWQSIPFGNWRKFLRCGYGLDICLPNETNPLSVYVQADLIVDDLGELPNFNLITCISTLEHIGCDNRIYHPDFLSHDSPFDIQKSVFQKLLSKVSPQGRFCLSLPYGKRQNNEWFLQYDREMVDSIKILGARSKCRLVSEIYYRLNDRGWQKVNPDELSNVEYRLHEKRAAGVVLLEFAKI